MRNFIHCVSALAVLLAGASSVQAADIYWDGGGADDLWTTPENWVGDAVPNDTTDLGLIDDGFTALVDHTVNTSAGRVVVGMYDPATMNVTGGSITSLVKQLTVGRRSGSLGVMNISGGAVHADEGVLIGNSAGSNGTINMTGGAFIVQSYSGAENANLIIGDAGTGTLNMSGGIITANNNMYISDRSSGGTVNMTGGTINVTGEIRLSASSSSSEFHLDGGLVTAADLVMTSRGSLDLMEGVMKLDGDDRSVIEGYINSGLITAYGGVGELSVDYDTVNDITTVSAIPDRSVSNPVPGNNADRVPVTPTLSWDPPNPLGLAEPNHPENVEYIVYFDPNEFLVTDGDPSVRFGPQFETEFSPSSALDAETPHYWRVDVVDPNFGGPIIYPGVVWTFTTLPPKAGLISPADGAADVAQNAILEWDPGVGAIAHQLYGDTDETLVINGDPSAYMGEITDAFVDPDLDWNTTYYWRVDEVFATGDPVVGDVWSFTTGTPDCEVALLGDIDNNCVVNLEVLALMDSNWLICKLTNGDCP